MRALVCSAVLLASTAAMAAPVERRLYSDTLEASSFLWNDWNKFVENYHPNYIADDDPATAWVEGAKGSGKGEWIRMQTTPLDKTTAVRLHIRNGYQKSKDLFKANARVKTATIKLLPSGVTKSITLADADGWQDVTISQPSGALKGVELHVDGVYEGTKYEDLCISDVQIFATSETPDNPAAEKAKHDTLMKWRSDRLAAAKTFTSGAANIPLYPAYDGVTQDLKHPSGGVFVDTLAEVVDSVPANDPALAKEWSVELAAAKTILASQDTMQRSQVTPVKATKLVVPDGMQVLSMANQLYGVDDPDSVHLPMLGDASVFKADQLRMLDLKDALTPTKYVSIIGKCGKDVAWVSRAAATADSPARVVGLMYGHCEKVEVREGTENVRAVELYVFDATGKLKLVVGRGHVDGYRWVDDGGKPMIASAHAWFASGDASLDVKKKETVAAK
ncbi:MAG TPA: hypothetical protein VGM88_28715 [Kofleriaceae bacterium]